MKMPAITPGPWHVEEIKDDETSPLIYGVCHPATVCDTTTICNVESEANAKAIAAVPANLAANLKALDILRRLLAEQQIDMDEVEAVADELDAALRLAGATE